MTFTIRPAVRIGTPIIVGIKGPSKSGKTYSAHRLARGLANGGRVVMLNAEGARGHQYADTFKYDACDIDAPFSYERYTEALVEISKLKPACVIVDSVSHAHDGPGGMIEQHDEEVKRRSGGDPKKAERVNWAAWIKPKEHEGKFIYQMLSMDCPIILCFRAKEKIKIVPGKEPIDLGYQAIASDRIEFETLFSLLLPPRSKGVPDLSLSDLREPFDTMIGQEAVSEALGKRLADWARGAPAPAAAPAAGAPAKSEGGSDGLLTPDQVTDLENRANAIGADLSKLLAKISETSGAAVTSLRAVRAVDYGRCVAWINAVADRKAAAASK